MTAKLYSSILSGLAELSLLGLSLFVVYNANRILTDTDSATEILLIALGVHLLLILSRQLGLQTWLRSLLAILIFFWLEVYFLFPETLTYAIPNATSLNNLRMLMSDGVDSIAQHEQLPVSGGDELQILIGIFVLPVVVLIDWTAFKYKRTGETLAPLVVLFVALVYLGNREENVWHPILLIGLISLFALVHSLTLKNENLATNLPTKLNAQQKKIDFHFKRRHLGIGALLALLAIGFGTFLGPTATNARSEAILEIFEDTATENNVGTRVLINPLLDIGNRLTVNPDRELFRVETNIPTYWRLTALDIFDGRIWSSEGRYSSPKNSDNQISTPRKELSQSAEYAFEIQSLGGSWVPLAYLPEIDSLQATDELLYSSQIGGLIKRDFELVRGDTYTLSAQQLNADPGTINRLSAEAPPLPEEYQKYIELPDNFSPEIASMAREITSSGKTHYEKSTLLQNWFHNNFTYDQTIQYVYNENAISNFLASKKGYCEQFSGTFAAMARSLGIPARVVVGFTPGEYSESEPEVLIVRSKHAHAWTEIYITDFGWVPFEPTPGGRGTQSDQTYLDSSNQAVPIVNLATPTSILDTPPAEDTQEIPSTTIQADNPPPSLDSTSDGATQTESEVNNVSPSPQSETINTSYLLFLIFSLLALLVYLPAVYISRRYQLNAREVRNLKIGSNTEALIAFAWRTIILDLSRLGIKRSSAETQSEFSKRVSQDLRLNSVELEVLASATNEAMYAPIPPDKITTEEALKNALTLHHKLESRQKGLKRILKWINPSPAFRAIEFRRLVKQTL